MKNTSGLIPCEFNIIVKQDEVSDKTEGGLYKPVENVERDKYAQTRGVIVAVSSMAFDSSIHPEGEERPKPGDKVAWVKHAGSFVKGADGEEYRVIKDKDVVARIEEMRE